MCVRAVHIKFLILTVILSSHAHFIRRINEENEDNPRSHSIEHYNVVPGSKDYRHNRHQSIDSESDVTVDDDAEAFRKYMKHTILHRYLVRRILDKLNSEDVGDNTETNPHNHWNKPKRALTRNSEENHNIETEWGRSGNRQTDNELNHYIHSNDQWKSSRTDANNIDSNANGINTLWEPKEIIVKKGIRPETLIKNNNEDQIDINTLIEPKIEEDDDKRKRWSTGSRWHNINKHRIKMKRNSRVRLHQGWKHIGHDSDDINSGTTHKIVLLKPDSKEFELINELNSLDSDDNDLKDIKLVISRILSNIEQDDGESDAYGSFKNIWHKLLLLLQNDNVKPEEREFLSRLLERMKKLIILNPAYLRSYLKSLEAKKPHTRVNNDKAAQVEDFFDLYKTFTIGNKMDEVDVPSHGHGYVKYIHSNKNVQTKPEINKYIRDKEQIDDSKDTLIIDTSGVIQEPNKIIFDQPRIHNQTIHPNYHVVSNVQLHHNPISGIHKTDHRHHGIESENSKIRNVLKHPSGLIKKICEGVNQNVADFWKIFYSYFSKQPKGRENLQDLEKLYLILTIFTQFNRAKQSGLSIERYVDEIIKIIQPDVHSLGSDLDVNDNPTTVDPKTLCVNCNEHKIKAIINDLIGKEHAKIPALDIMDITPDVNNPSNPDLDDKNAEGQNIDIKEPSNIIELIPAPETVNPKVKHIKPLPDAKIIKPVPHIVYVDKITPKPTPDFKEPDQLMELEIPDMTLDEFMIIWNKLTKTEKEFERVTESHETLLKPYLEYIKTKTIKPVPDKVNSEVHTIKPVPNIVDIEAETLKPVPNIIHPEAKTIKPVQDIVLPEATTINPVLDIDHVGKITIKPIPHFKETEHLTEIKTPDITFDEFMIIWKELTRTHKDLEPVTDSYERRLNAYLDLIKARIIKPGSDIVYPEAETRKPEPGIHFPEEKPIQHIPDVIYPDQSTETDFNVNPDNAQSISDTPLNQLIEIWNNIRTSTPSDLVTDLYENIPEDDDKIGSQSEKPITDLEPKTTKEVPEIFFPDVVTLKLLPSEVNPEAITGKPVPDIIYLEPITAQPVPDINYPEEENIKHMPEWIYPENITAKPAPGIIHPEGITGKPVFDKYPKERTTKPVQPISDKHVPEIIHPRVISDEPVPIVVHPEADFIKPVPHIVYPNDEDILKDTAKWNHTILAKLISLKKYYPSINITAIVNNRHPSLSLYKQIEELERLVLLNRNQVDTDNIEQTKLEPEIPKYIDETQNLPPFVKYLIEFLEKNPDLLNIFGSYIKEPETHVIINYAPGQSNLRQNEEVAPNDHPNSNVYTKIIAQIAKWNINIPWEDIYKIITDSMSDKYPNKPEKGQTISKETHHPIPDENNLEDSSKMTDAITKNSLNMISNVIIRYLKELFRDLGLEVLIRNLNFDVITSYLTKILLVVVRTLSVNGVSLRVVIKVIMELGQKMQLFQEPVIRDCVQRVYAAMIQVVKSIIDSITKNMTK